MSSLSVKGQNSRYSHVFFSLISERPGDKQLPVYGPQFNRKLFRNT